MRIITGGSSIEQQEKISILPAFQDGDKEKCIENLKNILQSSSYSKEKILQSSSYLKEKILQILKQHLSEFYKYNHDGGGISTLVSHIFHRTLQSRQLKKETQNEIIRLYENFLGYFYYNPQTKYSRREILAVLCLSQEDIEIMIYCLMNGVTRGKPTLTDQIDTNVYKIKL